MKRSILLIIILSILLSGCALSVASTPTASPPPTNTSLPTAIPPTATDSPTPTVTITPTSTATPTAIPVFWDDFNGEFLSGWSWIRENDDLWSLGAEPGYLRIVLTADNPPRNLLVREVTQQDFQIMTHVRFKPTSNFQFAGLLVYLDDGNLLALGRAFCNRSSVCVGNGIYFDAVQNSKTLGKNYATATQIKDDAYLRMDKDGTKFIGYYSDNGTDWVLIGEHEFSMINPHVGLITSNSHVVGMTASFDFFTLVEEP